MVSYEELVEMARLHDLVCDDRSCDPMTYAHLYPEAKKNIEEMNCG